MAADVAEQIMSIIRSYKRVADDQVAKVTRSTARECAEKLNEASKVFGSDITHIPYAGSWHATKDSEGGYTVHSDVPGLPHLLEDGHNLIVHGKAGGYVPGITHIRPVAEEMAEEFETRMREALEG